MLEQTGDLRQAHRRYRQALTGWDADADNLDAETAYCAALASDELDDPRGALAWYRRAAALGHRDAAREVRQRALTDGKLRQRTLSSNRSRHRPAQQRGSTRP